MMKFSKRLAMCLALSLVFVFVSFGNGQKEAPKSSGGKLDISYWIIMEPNLAQMVTTFADRPFWKQVMDRTNTDIKFIHPALGQETEQFNLMIASGDYPDLLDWNWTNYPGGPEKAISDKVIIPLNDLIDANAPNYKAILAKYPEADRQAKTDKGTYYSFGRLMVDPINQTYIGLIIRNDWLQDLGLQVPTTIGEWHDVLKAFKDKEGAAAPLTLYPWHLREKGESYPFIGAYGITGSFYQVDGKVGYGPIQPQFKQFLTTFNQWYKEGLIDPEFIVNDANTYDYKITTGKSGAFIGYTSGHLGRLSSLMKAKDPTVSLVGAPYPSLVKGDTPKIGNRGPVYQPISLAISTDCKDPAAVVKFIDYLYSEKGTLLSNFGIEGESFVMKDGKPVLTDLITGNKDHNLQTMLLMYTQAIGAAPLLASPELRAQMNFLPEMTDAMMNKWSNSNNEYGMPANITPTPEESGVISSIMTEINTYQDEMVLKFILGIEPLDKFEAFTSRIKTMGIDKAVAIKQASLDRYNNR
jgi:putative aldouronate transport system substrate-binding protein